jgi:hypothetical protein
MNKRKTLDDLNDLVTVNEFKIKPPVKNIEELTIDERMACKLHPLYPAKFISIYGPTYSMKNLMSILKSDDKYFKYINSVLKGKDLSELINATPRHRDNYWGIIELNMVDRLFKDKKLLNYLLKHYDDIFVNSKPIVYNTAKRGIVNVDVVDKITTRYVKLIKNIVDEVFSYTININDLDKESFKDLKIKVKTNILEKVFSESDTEQLIDSISNNELRDAYLK